MDSFDIICILGRGSEKVNGVWRPTQAIERLTEKYQHPGVRVPNIGMDDDDPLVVYAGAEFNALAGALLYKRLRDDGSPPAIVVFAAGRTACVADDPDPTLSEGQILKERFLEETGIEPQTEIVVQDKNRNTRDDLLQMLSLARERSLRSMVVLTVLVHWARSRMFFTKALETDPELGSLSVKFWPSEMILIQEGGPELTSQLPELFISQAYCHSAFLERKGVQDLRTGRYRFNPQGYNFAQK